MSVKVPTIQV